MKSFTTLLATGTFFAATAFAQESIQSAYDGATEPSTGADEPSVTADPSLPTTIASAAASEQHLPTHLPVPVSEGGASDDHENRKITVTIDGTFYIPATLCADYAASSAVSSVGDSASTWAPVVPSDVPSSDVTTTMLADGTVPSVHPSAGSSDATTTTTLADGAVPSEYSSAGSSDATTMTTTTTTLADGTMPSDYSSAVPDAPGVTSGIAMPSDYTTTDITHPTTIASDHPAVTATAKIQLTKYSEKSRKFDIPIDNTLFPLVRPGYQAFEMTVVNADDESVKCQCFSDKKGNEPLGEPIAMGEKGDVTKPDDHGMGRMSWVRAVRCSAAGSSAAVSSAVVPLGYSSAVSSAVSDATSTAPSAAVADGSVPSGYSDATTAIVPR